MGRPKKEDKERYSKTTVLIKDFHILKQYLAWRGITLKDYLNELIRKQAIEWPELLAVQYYKAKKAK